MIKSGALAVGWNSAERMTPASYATHFVSEFVLEWMPILKPRNALNYAALTIPITAALCAFGGFLVAQEAARRMLPRGRGTILFTGASGSLRGNPGFAAFAAAKGGLRFMAQSMARELGPKGIHVATVLLDGAIDSKMMWREHRERMEKLGSDGALPPDAVAETYWQIHCQPRNAWSFEVDLRPWTQAF